MNANTPAEDSAPRYIPSESRVIPAAPLDQLDASLSILRAVILARHTRLNPERLFGCSADLEEALVQASRLLGSALDTLEDYAELIVHHDMGGQR